MYEKNLCNDSRFIGNDGNAGSSDIGADRQVKDISDGGIAVGNIFGTDHFMSSLADGESIIGEAADLGVSGNECISADGTSISASVINPATGIEQVGIYTPSTNEWVYLEGLGTVSMDSESSAWGMSSNGNHIVGLSWANASTVHAALWTEMESVVDLGTSVPNNNSRANAVNADGTIVVGWQQNDLGWRIGVYWENGVQHLLLDDDGNEMGEALAVSADGKTITGLSLDGSGFIWDKTDGTTLYTHENGDYNSSISAISDDGETAVGFAYNPFQGILLGEGFIWTKQNGFQNLDQYIQDLGYDTLDLTFSVVTAISPNGDYIGGIGVNWNEEEAKGFVINIGDPLSVDSVENKNSLSLYPNPVKDMLNFTTKEPIKSIAIFNLLGQKVLEYNSINNNQINLSILANGTYIAKILTESGINAIKIIKE